MARKYTEQASGESIAMAPLNVTDPSTITWEEWTEESFELFELPTEAAWFYFAELHRVKRLKF